MVGFKLSSYTQDSLHLHFGCTKTTTKIVYLLQGCESIVLLLTEYYLFNVDTCMIYILYLSNSSNQSIYYVFFFPPNNLFVEQFTCMIL